MIRRPPRSTPLYSSAASDVYKRQLICCEIPSCSSIASSANSKPAESRTESSNPSPVPAWWTIPSHSSLGMVIVLGGSRSMRPDWGTIDNAGGAALRRDGLQEGHSRASLDPETWPLTGAVQVEVVMLSRYP